MFSHSENAGLTGSAALNRFRQLLTAFFFLLVLATGLLIFRDYGTFVDEEYDSLTGLVNARYILKQLAPELLAQYSGLHATPELDTFHDRVYGVLYQLPAAVIPQVLGFTDTRENYFTRHLLVFLYFFAGLAGFYFVLKQRFGQSWWPLLGTVMLVLSPRIFADSFYNGKDIVFLSFIILSWFTLNKLRQTLTLKWTVLHALTSAMAFDTRIMGFLMVGLTFLWLAHLAFYSGSWAYRKKAAIYFTVYCVLFAAFSILFWPHLWLDTWSSLIEVFQKIERGGKTATVLYFGKFITFNALPWHYAPVWLFITTPLIYSFWFLIGLFGFFVRFLKEKIGLLHSESGQQDATALLLFFLPLVVVIGTRAVLYDGWRHLFFIYPAFLYLAVLGMQQTCLWWQKNARGLGVKSAGWLLASLTLIGLFRTLWLMVSMHPFQNVYFSFLPPAYIEQHFERDYWGLSYRNGLEYILEHDKRPEIKVGVNFTAGLKAPYMLKPEARKRLKLVPEAEADYYLTEYRWHPQPYPYSNEVYTIKANGLKILSVFKLK